MFYEKYMLVYMKFIEVYNFFCICGIYEIYNNLLIDFKLIILMFIWMYL